MILSYFLLFIYAALLVILVRNHSFFQLKTIPKNGLVLFVSLKMLAGILYIFFHERYIVAGDIFHYFNDGNIIYAELWDKPLNYLQLVFAPNNSFRTENIEPSIDALGFWGDTGAYTVVRFNALIRLISMGNIYIHGVFSGFISFIGCFLLAKTFEKTLNSSIIPISSFFLLPSLLFWTSGVHKEFITVASIGLLFYCLSYFSREKSKFKYAFLILVSLSFLFFARDYMMLLLITPLLLYGIAEYVRNYQKWIFGVGMVIAFLTACYIPLPFFGETAIEIILAKRHLFESLKAGNTSIELSPFSGSIHDLLLSIPQSIFNVVARPHFGDIDSLFLFITSIETLAISLLIIMGMIALLGLKDIHNFALLILSYSTCLLVVIGLIVPNIGAIVRYRSTAFFLLIPLCIHFIYKYWELKKVTTK